MRTNDYVTPPSSPRTGPPSVKELRKKLRNDAKENRDSSGLNPRRSLIEEKFETPVLAYWENKQKQTGAVEKAATRKRKRCSGITEPSCVKMLFEYPTLLPYYRPGKRRRNGLDQPPTLTRSLAFKH